MTRELEIRKEIHTMNTVSRWLLAGLMATFAVIASPSVVAQQTQAQVYLVLDGHMYPMNGYSTVSYAWLMGSTYALDLPGAGLYNCDSADFDGVWSMLLFFGYVDPPVMIQSAQYAGYSTPGGPIYVWTVESRYGGVTCNGEIPMVPGYLPGNDTIFADGFDVPAAGGAAGLIFADGFELP